MARVPPGDDEDPELIEFGIPVLDDRLAAAELSFPATVEEVEAALGGEAIPYDAAGRTVDLSTALAELDRERFETEHELLDALHPVFETYRERRGSGVIDRLRSLVPF